jgi:electron transfer flavoprotein beta subunit
MQITPPEERKAGRVVEGETAQEKAANLARLLREEAKVI